MFDFKQFFIYFLLITSIFSIKTKSRFKISKTQQSQSEDENLEISGEGDDQIQEQEQSDCHAHDNDPLFYRGEPLPITPKGLHLTQHFGGSPETSPYGPQPTVIIKDNVVIDEDGRIQTTTTKKLIHTSIPNEGQSCDITEDHNFEFCLMLHTCDLCNAYTKCGWCEATNRCLPGNDKYAICPTGCVGGWVYGMQSCKGEVFGQFDNVAEPEALGIITPEMAAPKYHVHTVITHPAVIHTPVLLGSRTERYEVQRVNALTGEMVSNDVYDMTKPIVGEVNQVAIVNTNNDQWIDAITHKRYDIPPVMQLHGYSQNDKGNKLPDRYKRRRRRFY